LAHRFVAKEVGVTASFNPHPKRFGSLKNTAIEFDICFFQNFDIRIFVTIPGWKTFSIGHFKKKYHKYFEVLDLFNPPKFLRP
jgi:hypothetical protein